MSFLQKPLYLSSLTVLLNLPPSAVLLQQAELQQIALQQAAHHQAALQQMALQRTATQQPAPQQDAADSHISTYRLQAVQTAVQQAVAGGCMYNFCAAQELNALF